MRCNLVLLLDEIVIPLLKVLALHLVSKQPDRVKVSFYILVHDLFLT